MTAPKHWHPSVEPGHRQPQELEGEGELGRAAVCRFLDTVGVNFLAAQ